MYGNYIWYDDVATHLSQIQGSDKLNQAKHHLMWMEDKSRQVSGLRGGRSNLTHLNNIRDPEVYMVMSTVPRGVHGHEHCT